jgi:hypothetical protein
MTDAEMAKKGISCFECIHFAEDYHECRESSPFGGEPAFSRIGPHGWCGDFVSRITGKYFVDAVAA